MRPQNRFQKKEETVNFPKNEEIKAPEVRLVSDKGMVGVMPLEQALALAKEQEMDLVLISPKAVPPVAKIIDYNSFKYQQEKLAKKMKATAKQVEMKSIRLSARIGQHDMETRLKQAQKFMEKGDKVKIELFLRDRERQHGEIGFEMIKKFLEALSATNPFKVEAPAKRTGSRIETVIAPTK